MTEKNIHIAFMVGSLRMGGAERMVIHSANELSKHLHVSLLSLTGGEDLKRELNSSVALHCFEKKKSLSAVPAVLKFLREKKPDVLVSTQIHVNLIAVLLKIFFRVKTKIILREATTPGSHFLEFDDFKSKLVKMAVRILYPRADAIVAICEAVKDSLTTLRFARPEQIAVIYNPVVNPEFLERMKENAEHPFFKSGNPVIISVGRLAPAKNFTLLIKAFNLLQKEIDARLLIIGEGQERKRLSSLISELGLNDKIILTGQLVNPYPYLKKATVYVLSSFYEGLPNALIEAMACGIQAVSVDCPGGSREILLNGKLGRLVKVNDPEALAIGMKEAIEFPVERKLLLDGSRRFESEKTAQGYLTLIKKLLK